MKPGLANKNKSWIFIFNDALKIKLISRKSGNIPSYTF